MLNKKILDVNDKYILAISGGVDSMVLLDLFIKNKYNFIVCYVDHDKREKSFLDGILVKDVCNKNNIIFESIKLDYSEYEKNENFQAIARKKRYKFFKETAIKYNIRNIVTAHHADDLIETVILKMLRGSNLYGYAGIHEIVYKDNLVYLRPLLKTTKEKIINYANENNIKYLEDESNSKNDYKRNRIRHNIVPLLKNESFNLDEKIYQYYKTLEMYFFYVRNKSNKLINGLNIYLDKYIKEDELIRLDSINYLLETINVLQTEEKIYKIDELLMSKKNFTYNLGNNYILVNAYNNAYVKKIDLDNKSICEKYDTFNNINFKFNNKKIIFAKNNINNNTNYLKVCYNKKISSIEIRTRKEKDFLLYPYGKKTLKKLFIDLKVPKDKRDELILLVINENEVIWIPELKIRNYKCENEDGYLIYEEVI